MIIFSLASGLLALLQRWQTPSRAWVHAAALSSDGSHANDGKLYAFNIAQFLENAAASWAVPIPGGATTIYGIACNLDGTQVAVAGNVPDGSGVVALFGNKYITGALEWHSTTAHAPNGLSMDLTGTYLAAADGHDTAGDFTLWQPLVGAFLWTYPTEQMCRPDPHRCKRPGGRGRQ